MAQLLGEMRGRARRWMPDWRPADPGLDPADIVLRAAARVFSEVTSRLDAMPDKVFRDYLYWLGVAERPGQAARIPLVFRLAPGAESVMLAGTRADGERAPVLLQAIADSDPVPFEIDTPVFLQGASLAMIIGARPGDDFYTEAPAGLLTPSGPAEGIDRWELAAAIDQGATSLQLRPTTGCAPGMQLIDQSGGRYRVKAAKDGLVEIDPGARQALGSGHILRRAEVFDPFPTDGLLTDAEPNRQTHALYLGSMTALDVSAAAQLELVGRTPPGDAIWHYWGKTAESDTPDWQDLTRPTVAGRYVLDKPAGAIEPLAIGGVTSRWLRATLPPGSAVAGVPTTVATLALRINPGGTGGEGVAYDAMAPTVQLVTDQPFLPFGREPRRFDSFHIGSDEAFSKPGACVRLDLELGDSFATAMSVAWLPDDFAVAAAVGNDGRLLRVALDEAQATPTFLMPIQPALNGRAVSLSRKSRPGAASYAGRAAFAAGDDTTVWFWLTATDSPEGAGDWQDLGAPGSGELGDVILISEGDGQDPLRVYAVQGGIVYSRRADVADRWSQHYQPMTPTEMILRLSAVDGAEDLHGRQPLHHVLAAIAADGQLGLITGQEWKPIHGALKCDPLVYPQVILDPDDSVRLVAGFAKVASDPGSESEASAPVAKIFVVDRGTKTCELEVDLIGQALAPLRLGQKDERGVLLAARGKDGTTALHLWSPFLGGFDQVVDPMPTSSRYVQSPVPMTPDGLWLCPRFGGSVGMTRVTEGAVTSASVLKCLTLPDADPNEDWTNRLLRVPDTSASLMRVSFALPSPGGGTFIVPDRSWDLPPGSVRAESFRGSPVRAKAIGDQQKVDVPLTPELAALLADPNLPAGEIFLGFEFDGKPRLVRAEPELPAADPPAADPVVFRPVAGTPDFNLEQLTDVFVCVRLEQTLAGRIEPVAEVPSPPGPRLAVFDWDTRNELAFVKFDTGRPGVELQQLLVLATDDDVQQVVLSETLASQSLWSPSRPRNPNLSWEYWNGRAWATIPDLVDGTNSFVTSGEVKFCVPDDLAPTEVLGRPNSWIRARLVDGDYGTEEVWVEEDKVNGQRIVRRDASTVRAPLVVRLSVRYSLNCAKLFANVLTEDAGTLRDQTAINDAENATIPIFVHLSDDLERQVIRQDDRSDLPVGQDIRAMDCGCGSAPGSASGAAAQVASNPAQARALFLGIDAPLAGAPVNLFFQIPRDPGLRPLMLDVSGLTSVGFRTIASSDGTFGLSETGILSLDLQVPLEPTVLFGRRLHWLRIAPVGTGSTGVWAPRVSGIHLNAAWASAAETQSSELLGSSDASPGQRFRLARPPIVRGSLEVRVRELLGPDEAAALAAKQRDPAAVLEQIGSRSGPWVLWTSGDLTTAGPDARIYSLDAVTGEITFGDGAQGRIPPAGRDAIMAVRYRTGGTAAANAVKAWGQVSLVSAVQGVEAVLAPEPAAGGSDPETVDEVLRTAPAKLAMRDRAVTLQDIGRLALRASDGIGQAVALNRPKGAVALVIAMRGAEALPSNATLRETTRFLQARVSPSLARQGALVAIPPRPVPLSIDVEAQADGFENLGSLRAQIVLRILAMLDPASGGARGQGWPFGRLPTTDDIAAAIQDVPHLVTLLDVAIRQDGSSTSRLPADAMVVARADRIQVRAVVGVEQLGATR
ncbi:MAG: hypothetical protein ING01_05485 [Rhodobacter sp.]|nr:hypothetical protein [Rhodobacter sp.]